MDGRIDTYDWQQAFLWGAAGFTRNDVVEIIAIAEGKHDGDDWRLVVRLKNGRYAFLLAGCTDSGCHSPNDGYSTTDETLAWLIRFKLSAVDRQCLGLK